MRKQLGDYSYEFLHQHIVDDIIREVEQGLKGNALKQKLLSLKDSENASKKIVALLDSPVVLDALNTLILSNRGYDLADLAQNIPEVAVYILSKLANKLQNGLAVYRVASVCKSAYELLITNEKLLLLLSVSDAVALERKYPDVATKAIARYSASFTSQCDRFRNCLAIIDKTFDEGNKVWAAHEVSAGTMLIKLFCSYQSNLHYTPKVHSLLNDNKFIDAILPYITGYDLILLTRINIEIANCILINEKLACLLSSYCLYTVAEEYLEAYTFIINDQNILHRIEIKNCVLLREKYPILNTLVDTKYSDIQKNGVSQYALVCDFVNNPLGEKQSFKLALNLLAKNPLFNGGDLWPYFLEKANEELMSVLLECDDFFANRKGYWVSDDSLIELAKRFPNLIKKIILLDRIKFGEYHLEKFSNTPENAWGEILADESLIRKTPPFLLFKLSENYPETVARVIGRNFILAEKLGQCFGLAIGPSVEPEQKKIVYRSLAEKYPQSFMMRNACNVEAILINCTVDTLKTYINADDNNGNYFERIRDLLKAKINHSGEMRDFQEFIQDPLVIVARDVIRLLDSSTKSENNVRNLPASLIECKKHSIALRGYLAELYCKQNFEFSMEHVEEFDKPFFSSVADSFAKSKLSELSNNKVKENYQQNKNDIYEQFIIYSLASEDLKRIVFSLISVLFENKYVFKEVTIEFIKNELIEENNYNCFMCLILSDSTDDYSRWGISLCSAKEITLSQFLALPLMKDFFEEKEKNSKHRAQLLKKIIVCFKKSPLQELSSLSPEQLQILYDMVRKNYSPVNVSIYIYLAFLTNRVPGGISTTFGLKETLELWDFSDFNEKTDYYFKLLENQIKKCVYPTTIEQINNFSKNVSQKFPIAWKKLHAKENQVIEQYLLKIPNQFMISCSDNRLVSAVDRFLERIDKRDDFIKNDKIPSWIWEKHINAFVLECKENKIPDKNYQEFIDMFKNVLDVAFVCRNECVYSSQESIDAAKERKEKKKQNVTIAPNPLRYDIFGFAIRETSVVGRSVWNAFPFSTPEPPLERFRPDFDL